MFYDQLLRACERRNVTVTQLLRDLGRAEGNTGNWKAGKFPRLDFTIEIAEYLHISLDELVYGDNPPYSDHYSELISTEQKLLEVFSRLNMSLNNNVSGSSTSLPVHKTHNNELSDTERELLDIFSRIPEGHQQLCLDFLKTHMVQPEKHLDKKNA